MHDFAEALIPIIAIIFTFGIPGLIIFWAIQSKHRERMKLIDKGLTPEEVRAYYAEGEKKPKNPYSTLKWGILFAFLGLGLFISYIMTEVYDTSDSITPAFLLFFGGIGFIVYYIIASSKMKKDSNGNSVQKQ
jgi:phage shock protein PspC (stress-responsive transcriptional regulator)